MRATSRLSAHRPALLGVVYLLVLALLAGVCVLAYRKALPWQRSVAVVLRTARPGLELNPGSDVKLRSRLVGRVDGLESDGSVAIVHLSLDPGEVRLVPRDVDAAIVPKTLFGEKFVELLPPAKGSSGPIGAGDVIRQSSTAVELGDVYARLVPVLRALDPGELSTVLNGLAEAVAGRGRELGRVVMQVDAFLARLDPHLGTLQHDLRAFTRVLQVYGDAAPDLLRTLGNAAVISKRLLAPEEQRLRRLLDTVASTSDLTTEVAHDNAENLVALSRGARPLLGVLDTYSSTLPCSLRGLHLLDKLGNQVTGARGPFTNLNVDLVVQGDPYVYPRDLPRSPHSDANDANLPPGIPSFAPHCPRFGRLTEQVRDAGPFSLSPLAFQARGHHGSGARADGRLGGLLVAPLLYDGRAGLP